MDHLYNKDCLKRLNKVRFVLNEQEAYSSTIENIWAEKKGAAEEYIVRNVPFYKRGVSYGDVIRVAYIEEVLEFKDVLSRSGHSTYRIFMLKKDKIENVKNWRSLENLGCTYEKATENLYAIDVPVGVDIYLVYNELEEGEKSGFWEFEEGHYCE